LLVARRLWSGMPEMIRLCRFVVTAFERYWGGTKGDMVTWLPVHRHACDDDYEDSLLYYNVCSLLLLLSIDTTGLALVLGVWVLSERAGRGDVISESSIVSFNLHLLFEHCNG
jgi:hypothetical protein